MSLQDKSAHAWNADFCKDFRVRYLFLPHDLREIVQAAHVEVLQLYCVFFVFFPVDPPGFTSIQESGELDGTVNLQLAGKADFSRLLYVLSKSLEGRTCFDPSAVDLTISMDSSRDGTSPVANFVNCLKCFCLIVIENSWYGFQGAG